MSLTVCSASLEVDSSLQVKTYNIGKEVHRIKYLPPPQIITVIITITLVVVKRVWRATDNVFLIAKANAIAPRRPEKNSMC
jgi:hypothetical protein